jgi:hypothetical protein
VQQKDDEVAKSRRRAEKAERELTNRKKEEEGRRRVEEEHAAVIATLQAKEREHDRTAAKMREQVSQSCALCGLVQMCSSMQTIFPTGVTEWCESAE